MNTTTPTTPAPATRLDPRDLVPGCYVFAPGETDVRVVEGVWRDRILTSTPGGSDYFGYVRTEKFEPVEITPDWLKKLGFTESGLPRAPYWLGPTPNIVVYNDWGRWVLSLAKATPLTGVHHLQTLVWQLCRVWLSLEEGGGKGGKAL